MFDSSSHPIRRLEGFHVPQNTSASNHHHISNQNQNHPSSLSISPHMLHSPFSQLDSQTGIGSSLFTDAELLESLIGSTTNSNDYSIPDYNNNHSNSNHSSSTTYQQLPLRNLPRHLDLTHSPSPSSPLEIYSPTGSSSGGPNSNQDFLVESNYGTFIHDEINRIGRPPSSINIKSPTPRSKSARRPSSSTIRHSLLSRNGLNHQLNGHHETDSKPMAASVPTYLSSPNSLPDWKQQPKVSFQLDHHHQSFAGSCSPSESILSSVTQPVSNNNNNNNTNNNNNNNNNNSSMKEEVSSLIGSPVFGNRSIDNNNPVTDETNAVLSEKRRRRRESHNAVERRRRENINERIQELCKLLPTIMLDEVIGGLEEEGGGTNEGNLSNNNNNKHNKGFILAKSVDYIKHLKEIVEHQSQENQELKQTIKLLKTQQTQTTTHEQTFMDTFNPNQKIDETSFLNDQLNLWSVNNHHHHRNNLGESSSMSVDHHPQ
ncbi:hypothetical protein CROQUDRAFT_99011 [Cronartium quercuum f. sp. fusiforme G11]|uniref:BHLH domain-containing protein n=1 Tax=Cronartium quercuum f. sp. fusiforme G11 TaxID=708437 RepID=A0A9P6T753_9BASI|nr:hypothetical protein CROQUDRAFT_99011 [Cronartium quercuum f. sp. fusiforme G11]